MATHYDTHNSSIGGGSAGMIALAVLVVLVVAGVFMFSGSQTGNAPMVPGAGQTAPQSSGTIEPATPPAAAPTPPPATQPVQ